MPLLWKLIVNLFLACEYSWDNTSFSVCICQNKLGWFSCFSAPAGDPWSVILLENQTVMSHSLLNIDLKHQLQFNFSSLALAWHLPWLISPGVRGWPPLVIMSVVVCLTLKHRQSNRAQIFLAIVLKSEQLPFSLSVLFI